jgi:hypothetical protein
MPVLWLEVVRLCRELRAAGVAARRVAIHTQCGPENASLANGKSPVLKEKGRDFDPQR